MTETTTLAEALDESRFTLAMSSGFFGFYAHGGMLSALVDSGLTPDRVVGSSAGALIGGCFAAGLSVRQIRELLFDLGRDDFWDPGIGFGLLAGRRMDDLLRQALPVDCFEETSVPFACSAWHLRTRTTEILDTGDLPRALRASAAFPLLFQPVRVGDGLYLDGGIDDRPAFAPLGDGERTLYHHLATRSPWRRGEGARLDAPTRTGVVSVDLGTLPRVGPFRLHEGRRAWRVRRQWMLRRVEEQVVDPGW